MNGKHVRPTRWGVGLVALLAAAAATLALAGSASATAISSVVTSGPGAPGPCASAVFSIFPARWSGTLGCWTDGTGPEPSGYSQLTATMGGSGSVGFTWRFRTTDVAGFDWVDIIVDGSCYLCGYNPNPALGNLFNSGWMNTTIGLSTTGPHTLVIRVHQDAFGDEASLDFTNLKGNLQKQP